MLTLYNSVVPPLFFILSFWTGSAILIGVLLWLRDIHNGKYDGQALKNVTGIWLVRGIFLTVISSFLYNWVYASSAEAAKLWPEIIVLSALTCAFFAHHRRSARHAQQSLLRALMIETFHLIFLAIVIIMIWILSYLVSIAVMHISMMALQSPFANLASPIRDAIIVVGALWLLPFYLFFARARKKADNKTIQAPKHFRFQRILWPILLCLLIFMLPLLMETLLHSKKFQKMMNPQPVLRVI